MCSAKVPSSVGHVPPWPRRSQADSSSTISFYYFHPFLETSIPVTLPWWQHKYKKTMDSTTSFTLLCLELLQVARDKATNIFGSCITSNRESSSGNKRNFARAFGEMEIQQEISTFVIHRTQIILICHPGYLLLGFAVVSSFLTGSIICHFASLQFLSGQDRHHSA